MTKAFFKTWSGWLAVVAVVFFLAGWVLSRLRSPALLFRSSGPAGASVNESIVDGKRREATPKAENAKGEYLHLFDRAGDAFLAAKTDINNEMGADLWLEAAGKRRFIAGNVTGAKFSPDGQKMVYVTSRYEVFIETLEGKRLAHILRASDPKWGADSTTVNFSAMADADYPEIQQTAVFDLNAGHVAEPRNSN